MLAAPGDGALGRAPVSYFALDPASAVGADPGAPGRELRQLVRRLHEEGLEVLLQVRFTPAACWFPFPVTATTKTSSLPLSVRTPCLHAPGSQFYLGTHAHAQNGRRSRQVISISQTPWHETGMSLRQDTEQIADLVLRRWSTASRARAPTRRPRPHRCAAWTPLSTTAVAPCSTAATPRCFPPCLPATLRSCLIGRLVTPEM